MRNDDKVSGWWSVGLVSGGLLALCLLGLLIFRIGWVSYVENYELGYQFDSRTGQVTELPHTGYFVTHPIFVSVHTIDMRPMQVCLNASTRVLNCKLVKFNRAGLELFLSWHGRSDYHVYSTGSPGANGGSGGNLAEILKSYAYDGSGKSYPFLTVVEDTNTNVKTAP